MTNRVTRVWLTLVLLLAITIVARNGFEAAGAQAAFDFSVSLNGYSLSVAPSHGGYVQVTVSLTSGSPQTVTLSSSVSPQDGEVTASFAQTSGTPPFLTTLIVSALAAPPGKMYTITVTGMAQGLTRQAPPLTVTINCPQGPCPQPHVDSIDKTSYSQGESIHFKGSMFYPGDATASCLTIDNNATSVCQNQAAADGQGTVSGSMQVTSRILPGPQQFYLKDLTNGQQSAKVPLTVVTASALLTTTYVGQGSIVPSCPSGCSEPVGQAVNITAAPAAGWTFSGWNITGASCSGGLNSNPCAFTMPSSPVSANANYVQYQTLVTSYTGQGALSPSCPSGCQVIVGSTVSILATPASGWVITGYHLTSGVACGPQIGYTCTFTMPSYPVNFQVIFTETITTIKTTTTITYSVQTAVTSTTVTGSTATTTITMTTQSTTQLSGTQTTTTVSSTISTTNTQTQFSVATQLSTFITNTSSVATNLQDPFLELGLAAIILFSSLAIGLNAIKRFPPRGVITCARCGVKNSSPRKYCVGCGRPLKGS